MNFIETLKLRSKLFILFTLVTITLFITIVIGSINLNSMKKNIDSLYFGSLVPVTELHTIIQAYRGDLVATVYKAKNTDTQQSKITQEIQAIIKRVQKEWRSYASHFKRDAEMQYVEYTEHEIQEMNEYLRQIIKEVRNGNKIHYLSMDLFEKKVTHISRIVNKLIAYEIEIAKFERKNFLNIYDATILKLGSILALIIFGVMSISYYVLKSIQRDQSILEVTTKKLKKANKRLENASYTDSLTNLYNRRYFNIVYEREVKRAKRNHTSITFMMLDIDYFKQYNDTYGHIKGDLALKKVAQTMQKTLRRTSDFLFRLGGEEFGVLLVDTSEKDSKKVAGLLCEALRDVKIEHKSSKIDRFLTLSIGISCCIADDALNEEMLLSKADEMLYLAKKSGRNRYKMTTNISETLPRQNVKESTA